ncbi:hypothetical protein ACLB2K_006949 [Fragaria x ananassa]
MSIIIPDRRASDQVMDLEKRLAEATKLDPNEPEKRVRLTKEPINWEESIQCPATPTSFYKLVKKLPSCPPSSSRRPNEDIVAEQLILAAYSVCLVLAAYLLGVLIFEDLLDLSQILITLLAAILVVFLVLPIIIPIILTFFSELKPLHQESLIDVQREDEVNKSENEVIFSEVEDEKASDVDSLPSSERQKRISQLQAKLFQEAADGAVIRVKRRKGPHRGENFTLMQALIKADFWLIFVSLLLAAGSGLTVIDNLGQIVLSLVYTNTSIYVSMISIWNFLGGVGGGYFSEIIVRDYTYPRPVAMAIVQVLMAIELFYYVVGLPGQIYVSTMLIGLGYSAHWAILPATTLCPLLNDTSMLNLF